MLGGSLCLVFKPPLNNGEPLYRSGLKISVRVEIGQWWEFLRPFVAMKNLYLSELITFHIMYYSQELDGGRSTEVLPILQKFSCVRERSSGPPAPSRVVHCQELTQSVAERQLIGHPITITVS
jgi:hypothetical protein